MLAKIFKIAESYCRQSSITETNPTNNTVQGKGFSFVVTTQAERFHKVT